MATAARGLVDSLNSIQAELTRKVIRDFGKKNIDLDIASKWVDQYAGRAHVVLETIEQFEKTGSADMAALVVIDQQLRTLY